MVTGALGFIGSRTVRTLARLGQPCLALTRRPVPDPGPFADLGAAVTVAHADPADPASLRRAADGRPISGIVHLATPAFGPEGVRSTLDGLLNVLDAARAGQVPRIAIASTLGVYEGVPETPHREDARLRPGGPVPAIMYAKELVGALAADGLQVVNLRIATVWGPGNPWRDAVVNSLTYAAVRGEPLAPLHADDATDLCFVADCARAIALLMCAGNLRHSTYNVGAGRPTSSAQLREALARIVPSAATLPLSPGRNPSGPGHDTWLDITRLRQDTAYEPSNDLDSGLREYVDHLRAGHPR